jgi:hypothetical protein
MKVTLAYPWTDEAGKNYKADSTVTVDDATGRSLIHDGKARPADEKTKD